MEKSKEKSPQNSKKLLWISALLTLTAVAIHTYLTFEYYDVVFGSVIGESICNLGGKFNCETVAASPWAAFYGIPMALLGATTNLILALLISISNLGWTDDPPRVLRYSFWLSTFVAFVSLLMGSISLTVVGAYCVFCIATYLLSFAVWGLLRFVLPTPAMPHLMSQLKLDIPELTKNFRWVTGLLMAAPILAFGFDSSYKKNQGYDRLKDMVAESLAYWQSEVPQNFDLSPYLASGMTKGDSEAVLTLVEFADFRCGHCKAAAPVLASFVASHPKVKLVFKNFPLDGSCNPSPNLRGSGEGISCQLASLVYCAESLNKKGWSAWEFVFKNQSRLHSELDKVILELAEVAGKPPEELKTCATSSETVAAITKQAQEGVNAKIEGTPTIFANGKLLKGGQTMPVLEAVYKQVMPGHF